MTAPSSATDDIQFVAYLPYLHWDTFKNLKKRAEVINRRRMQVHAQPIARDVAWGVLMEHKLIWQYLTSERPEKEDYNNRLSREGDLRSNVYQDIKGDCAVGAFSNLRRLCIVAGGEGIFLYIHDTLPP